MRGYRYTKLKEDSLMFILYIKHFLINIIFYEFIKFNIF